ncbi:MAG: GNAT family N-acetyltransferase [Deltaproteobacteria bacterium]|nr:GNAT family N-acetyltransferase [Deltaproteobacteria bacterium]
MDFVTIPFNSPLYKKELELRQKILRVPLGLNIYAEDLSQESQQLHFGLVENNELIACVVVVPLDNQTVKGRQMAVCESLQGTGIGRALINGVETELKKLGYKKSSSTPARPRWDFTTSLVIKLWVKNF